MILANNASAKAQHSCFVILSLSFSMTYLFFEQKCVLFFVSNNKHNIFFEFTHNTYLGNRRPDKIFQCVLRPSVFTMILPNLRKI